MSTLTQLRVMVRQTLMLADQTDVDSGDPSKSRITTLLNQSLQRRFLSLASSYPKKFVTRATLTYTASADSVALAAAQQGRMISQILQLPQGTTDYKNAIEMKAVNLDELDSYAATGAPEVYWLDIVGGNIWVRPVPDVATTLYLWSPAAVTLMSGDSDTPPPWMPAELHQLLAYDAAWVHRLESGDEDMRLKETADEMFDQLKSWVEQNVQNMQFHKNATTTW